MGWIAVDGRKDGAPVRARSFSPYVRGRADHEDGSLSARDNLLGDCPEEQPSGSAPAVPAHDDEVEGQLRRMLGDTLGHVDHLRGVNVGLHADAGKDREVSHFIEVCRGLIRGDEVPFAVHL